jgi:VanZ like family
VRTVSRAWFAAAIVVSALLVLGAPLVGQLTSWLRDVARGHYRDVLAAVVVSAAALSLGTALLVIKDRRAFRYSCLAAATAMAAGYAWAARTGVPDVDAAERFHFIEYGLVAVLFYKTWLPAHDGSVLLKPVVAGFIVGTLEEWLQWVVPGRVGEMHDVLLNLVAVWCGVLFALALDPPPRIPFALRPDRARLSHDSPSPPSWCLRASFSQSTWGTKSSIARPVFSAPTTPPANSPPPASIARTRGERIRRRRCGRCRGKTSI